MQQEISAEQNTPNEAIKAAKKEDANIWERQNFILGCVEMERITDEILIAVFSKLAKSVKSSGFPAEFILMDCESPLDDRLYNVGVRLSFEYEGEAIDISIIADPSDFTFTFFIEGLHEEISSSFKFYEVIPLTVQKVLSNNLTKYFPQIEYSPPIDSSDDIFSNFHSPFRVQFDDNGSVSDVATTATLKEAATMGSTFAKMFKKEDAITIVDANDSIVC